MREGNVSTRAITRGRRDVSLYGVIFWNFPKLDVWSPRARRLQIFFLLENKTLSSITLRSRLFAYLNDEGKVLYSWWVTEKLRNFWKKLSLGTLRDVLPPTKFVSQGLSWFPSFSISIQLKNPWLRPEIKEKTSNTFITFHFFLYLLFASSIA